MILRLSKKTFCLDHLQGHQQSAGNLEAVLLYAFPMKRHGSSGVLLCLSHLQCMISIVEWPNCHGSRMFEWTVEIVVDLERRNKHPKKPLFYPEREHGCFWICVD